jgi:hypothetical protein
MGVSTTDERHVALYDNTTHEAFGPVFESEEHAADFVSWIAEQDIDIRAIEPRRLSGDFLRTWQNERVNDEGELADDESAEPA